MLSDLRNFSIKSPAVKERGLFNSFFSLGHYTNSYTSVNEEADAMAIPTFYACVKVISETIAGLPLNFYKRGANGARIEINDHDQWYYWNRMSNEYVKSYNFRRQLIYNYLTTGNGFALIHMSTRNRPLGYTIEKNLNPFIDEGKLYYYNRDNGEIYLPREVIHLADLGTNEIWGKSKITQHAKTLGKTRAAQDYENKMYSNGLFLGGAIEYPETVSLTKEKVQALRETFLDTYGGLDKAGEVALIDSGGKFKPFNNTMPLSDFEFIMSESMTKEEICRIMGVPPGKIFHYYKSNYNSLEHQETEFWKSGIMPVCIQLEQEINTKIFRPSNKRTHFVKHDENAELRADLETQKEWFKDMASIGFYSINEMRALKDMPPVEGGDQRFVQANNMLPLDKMGEYMMALIDSMKKTENNDQNSDDRADQPGDTDQPYGGD